MKLHRLTSCAAALLRLASPLSAQVPNLVSYQGRISVGLTNFQGTGQFKFALVNAAGTTTHWRNAADTAPADGVPDAAVSLTVTKSLYSLLLGDTTITNMAAIPASVWSNADVRLRIWFNDGTNGFQLLTPDQRLAPNGYLPEYRASHPGIADVEPEPGAESPAWPLPRKPHVTATSASFLKSPRCNSLPRLHR